MIKFASTIVLAVFPAIAFAAGGHAGSHVAETKAPGADIQSMGNHPMGDHSMDGHSMSGMHGPQSESAPGKPGDPAKVDRTIPIDMQDAMRFTPQAVRVKAGETIRFLLKNSGAMEHEFVIGSIDALKAHAETMRKMPGMKHAESNMQTLAPGQRGGLVWQFDKAGTVDFACLIPGHFEAGMKGQIVVE
jgi:uncharacterized cupredoxin-like copper-binding protein